MATTTSWQDSLRLWSRPSPLPLSCGIAASAFSCRRRPRSVGAIVVYDVDTLTRDEQYALYGIAGNGRTQIVSTASKLLQPMLQAGAFNERLYYRLNVVTVDLTSPATPLRDSLPFRASRRRS